GSAEPRRADGLERPLRAPAARLPRRLPACLPPGAELPVSHRWCDRAPAELAEKDSSDPFCCHLFFFSFFLVYNAAGVGAAPREPAERANSQPEHQQGLGEPAGRPLCCFGPSRPVPCLRDRPALTASEDGKNRRLKQAKEEAQAEIEQYRLQREKEFKAKEAAALGSHGSCTTEVEKETQEKMSIIQQNFQKNREAPNRGNKGGKSPACLSFCSPGICENFH
uniref:ATPase H+ transporting V1 subunit G1 n=1 Tax=Apteryx owenii TaxID=8824 RepID=A0A8B9PPE8_APTOW